jgi:ubiquinone/menaquinone biosynthesis C-methylase UbiE
MTLRTPHESPFLRGPVALSHLLLRQFVRAGDSVVDATCGNGSDTLLLAELTAASGRVWAFDIQQQALAATTARLREADCLDHVTIVHAGHETLAELCGNQNNAIVFNLGYLPGGDRSVVTRPESTLAALAQCLKILKPGGIILITAYPGHDGGRQEAEALDEWIARLPPTCFHAWRMGQTNVPDSAPYLMFIQKAA